MHAQRAETDCNATQDVEVLPLIRDSALWTMGSDNADGDWEAAWKRRIDQQPGHSKGSGTPAGPRVEPVAPGLPCLGTIGTVAEISPSQLGQHPCPDTHPVQQHGFAR